jgi:hypothetical protein
VVFLVRSVGSEGQAATLALPGDEFGYDLTKPRIRLAEFLEGFNEPLIIGHPEPLGPVKLVFEPASQYGVPTQGL